MRSAESKNYYSHLLILTLSVVIIIVAVVVMQRLQLGLSCPIRSATGVQCPGCGGTRAMNYLLGGDFASSFASNGLISVGFILLVIYNVYYFFCRILRRKVFQIPLSLGVGVLVLTIVVIFTVIRNM